MGKKKVMFFKQFPTGGDLYDTDAQSFIDAVNTLTVSQQVAINNLVIGLKNNGTWSKYGVIYPFIGGTSTSHKWNLKDPRDLDLAHRITWAGSVAHDTNGITGNGSDAYGNLHFNKNDFWTSTNVGYQIYSRSDTRDIGSEFGVRPLTGGAGHIKCHLRYTTNYNYTISDIFGDTSSTGRFLVSPSLISSGLFSFNQLGETTHTVHRNGVSGGTKVGNYTANFTSVPDLDMFLLAHNRPDGAAEFTSRNLAFFTAGDALTPAEILTDYTVIQSYQTELSRSV